MLSRPAFFGKLPRHGDFVSRGLPDVLRDGWDEWCSAQLMAARNALGARFEARHDAAPSWRFTVNDGDSWAAGALAPSIDEAGRRFFIMAQFGELTAAEALAWGGPLSAVCEDELYRALADRIDGEMLLSRLTEAARGLDLSVGPAWNLLEASAMADGVWWTEGADAHAAARAVGRWPPPGTILMHARTDLEAASE
ncbi:type VI secretion system-associated protein TagF [Caulobacter flavus]|uniref:Type VI secretion system-associated protein TagF n=1 Tax=Caulobacter flavus TaxID=1679497 RepID=A0A2N5CZG7_9CAUL|nr:type VI secretion system-associated protein TagF [Caulobacter flavus]AYV45129.1 type VI secretion system-associated protein TagF [Caulobacter flavus]PLR19191.1 type VI secretion system-associated protein TagF [Caulobacter flavus]